MIYFLGFRKLVFEIIFTPRFNGVNNKKKVNFYRPYL